MQPADIARSTGPAMSEYDPTRSSDGADLCPPLPCPTPNVTAADRARAATLAMVAPFLRQQSSSPPDSQDMRADDGARPDEGAITSHHRTAPSLAPTSAEAPDEKSRHVPGMTPTLCSCIDLIMHDYADDCVTSVSHATPRAPDTPGTPDAPTQPPRTLLASRRHAATTSPHPTTETTESKPLRCSPAAASINSGDSLPARPLHADTRAHRHACDTGPAPPLDSPLHRDCRPTYFASVTMPQPDRAITPERSHTHPASSASTYRLPPPSAYILLIIKAAATPARSPRC